MGNIGQKISRGHSKNESRGTVHGLHNLGFGSRYGSRMRKRYREKLSKKMEELQQMQRGPNEFSSMQSLRKPQQLAASGDQSEDVGAANYSKERRR